jgi:ribonuclease HI
VTLLFDGGSSKGVGTAGFVIIDTKGNEIERTGILLEQGSTNNEAESAALHYALIRLTELEDQSHPYLSEHVRIFGDSQLVIKWHLGLFKKTSKPSLYQTVEGAKSIIRQRRWKPTFRNIPRTLNGAADDMCRRALLLPRPGRVTLLPAQV